MVFHALGQPESLQGGPEPMSIVHWGTDEGMAPGPLTTLTQTRDGYLWFGSEEGLMRFDGVRWTIFDRQNTPALRAKRVVTILEDEVGGLWVGTGGGGLAYRNIEGGWRSYGPDEGLDNGRVYAIARDQNGTVWAGTDGGGIFVLENERFRAFAGNDQLPSSHIQAMVPAQDGGIWVGSMDRLCRLREGAVDAAFNPGGDVPPDSLIVAVAPDGAVYVGGRRGLFVLRENRFSPVAPDFQLGRVGGLCFGAGERLWVGTSQGLVRIDGDQAVRLTREHGLAGNLVQTVFRDAEGSLWIASDVTGADQIRPTPFGTLSTGSASAHTVATGLYEDRSGTVWVGGHDGLRQFTPSGVKLWTEQDGLAADLVFTLCEGSEGTLWVGTFNGLSRLSDNGIETFREAEGFPARAVWCLYRDRQQQVWAGTPSGLVRVSNEGFEVFDHDNAGLSHNDVRSIGEDAQGRLWVGTSYGLNRWEDGRFTSFLESANGQSFNIVTALHGDATGDLWIGTMEGGLARYRDGVFTVCNRESGLYDDLIFCILEDAAGYLWMSCNRGVFRVSKADLNAHAEGSLPRVECEVYGVHDGLPSVECNGTFQPAGLRSRDGRLWFPTARGVGVVDPQRLSRNRRPPPVLVERLQVNGNAVAVPVPAELGPGVGELVIHYTALSFVAPKNVRFQYRLEGLDPDWVAETEVRSARYTQLSPGDYRFQVIACNNEGVWNREGAVLAFTVSPFWWQTGWFRWVAVISALGSVGATARFWTVQSYRRRMARLEQEHALERERNRIATDLHDDVGSNLGTIALLSESAQRSAEGEAAREFAEIHQLAASTADAMRDIVWFIDSGENELQALALRMKETAEGLLAGMTWEFTVRGTLPRCKLSTEFKRHFFLIFKESLHNIRKHAEASRVQLELGVTGGWVQLMVSDNGIGLQQAYELPGLGLMSMRRRAETQGWRLVLGPGAHGGTVVRLGAPLP